MWFAGSLYLDKIRDRDNDYRVPWEDSHGQGAGDLDEDDERHMALAWGAKTVGAEIGSFRREAQLLKEAQAIVKQFERNHGTDAYPRIREDLHWQAVKRPDQMPPRNFLTLCGLFAVLQKSRYKQISRERILCAAHGCKSKAVFDATIRCPWLSLDQIRGGLDWAIEGAGFVTAVTVGRRRTYYSTPSRLSASGIVDAINKERNAKANRRRLQILNS